jgi:PDDEXK-like domain of unknown function (DUF3799)
MPNDTGLAQPQSCCIEDLSNDAYHADRTAISSSVLKQLLITPAHCRHYLDAGGKDETQAMLTGTALHAALLEPERFAAEFAVVPRVDKRTKDGKQQWAAFRAEHVGKTLLAREEADLVSRLREGLMRHKRARALLSLPGSAELSLYWSDPETGLRLKARPDRLLRSPAWILAELKSTTRADKYHFQRKISDLDYHLSLAMYREGVRQVFGVTPRSVFLVVEDRTFEVCLYQPDVEMLHEGDCRFRYAVRLYAQCALANHWPGYQPDGAIEEISLPRWAAARSEHLAA